MVSKHISYMIFALLLLQALYIIYISSGLEHLCSEACSLFGIIKILVIAVVVKID